MPQDPTRIAQVEHPNSPRLHLRGLAHDAGILLGELHALDVLPPRIRILHRQAHHEVARMLGNVEGLQQEPEGPDLKLGNLVIAPVNGESEIGIKPLGEFSVFSGHESLEIGHGTRRHSLFLAQSGASSPVMVSANARTASIIIRLHEWAWALTAWTLTIG